MPLIPDGPADAWNFEMTLLLLRAGVPRETMLVYLDRRVPPEELRLRELCRPAPVRPRMLVGA